MSARKRQRVSGLASTLRRLQHDERNDDDTAPPTAEPPSPAPAALTSSAASLPTVEAAVLVGIMCSGKTAFARQHLARYAVVARKHLRARRGGSSERDAKLTALVARHFADGRNVVLDAAHASRFARARALASLQRAAASAGVRVRTTAYVFHVDVPRFIARNRRRAAFDAAARQPPDVVVEREARAFEWPATAESGFDELFFVCALDSDDRDGEASDSCDFQFDVQPYVGGRLHAPPLL